MEILLCLLEVIGYSEPSFLYLYNMIENGCPQKDSNMFRLETLQQNGGRFMFFFLHPKYPTYPTFACPNFMWPFFTYHVGM